jgi:prephenate dehydratase
MRVGYLGPPGTFSEQALRESAARAGAEGAELLPLPTIREVVLALERGEVDRALVPMENSLEGSVNEAIDTLLHDAPTVSIDGETVLAVHYALIGPEGMDPARAELVISHPQALAQCAGFLRAELPQARATHATSTAEAVRAALSSPVPACALATPLAASLYGGTVLRDNVEDDSSNMTRFVWLTATADEAPEAGGGDGWKSSVVFSGDGDGTPGWLVGCLAEFAQREVNLTRIESRPAKHRLGHYLFLVDVSGRADVPGAARDAVRALAGHCGHVRLLGAYRAAPPPPR